MKQLSTVRLLNLITTWWFENKFSFFRSLGFQFLLQLLVIWFWISMHTYSPPHVLWSLLTMVFLFMQGQRISNSFQALHNTESGTQWLLLPATPHEKLISIFFWNSLVFIISGIFLSVIMEKAALKIAEQLYISNPVAYEFRDVASNEWFFSRSYFTDDNGFMKMLWLFWLTAQFLFYWSAIRIRKGSNILSALILMAGFYVYGFYVRTIHPIFFKKNTGWDGAWEVNYNEYIEGIGERNYDMDKTFTTCLQISLIAVCIFLLYKACTHLISEAKISQ